MQHIKFNIRIATFSHRVIIIIHIANTTAALDVPVTCHSTIGDCSSAVTAARVWNSLPADVTSAPSLLVFRRLLKTELCRHSFPDN